MSMPGRTFRADPPVPLSLCPPWWFVRRYDAEHPGKVRTAADPMVLLAWHMATKDLRQPIVRLMGGSGA